MKFFHPEAARSFEARAGKLTPTLAEGVGDETTEPRYPPLHVSAAFGPSDIQSLGQFTRLDGAGHEIARLFVSDGRLVGFEGESYKDFAKLCESIHDAPLVRAAVSFDASREIITRWFKHRHEGGDSSLAAFFQREASELVKDHTVVIPVYELALQSPQTVGLVELRPMLAEQVDAWLDDLETVAPEVREHRHLTEQRLKRPFQGRAASWFSVRAEALRAYQLAEVETSDALAALRFYSRAAFLPDSASCCVPYGRQHVESDYYISLADGQFLGASERLRAPSDRHWQISDAMFTQFADAGLTQLSALLRIDQPTDFERRLRQAVLLYSRSTLTRDPTDKVVHILVALESLLLKNQSEPITSSLSDRLAFIVGHTPEERVEVAKVVRRAYALRSRYVHHGLPAEDRESVAGFMNVAWRGMLALVGARNQYRSLAQLHVALEKRKYL